MTPHRCREPGVDAAERSLLEEFSSSHLRLETTDATNPPESVRLDC